MIERYMDLPPGTRVIPGNYSPPAEVAASLEQCMKLADFEFMPARQPGAPRTAGEVRLMSLTTHWPLRANAPTPPGVRAAAKADPATEAARVRAALIGPAGQRVLPASDPAAPAPRFAGVGAWETVPAPKGLAERAGAK